MLAVLGLCAAAGLHCVNQPFVCQHSDQCVNGEVKGVCEPDRRCSFPDDSCPSKRRYGEYGTGRACVTAVCGAAGEACCADGACQAGLACHEGRCTCAPSVVAAGDSHTCVGFQDGQVACFGSNTVGQLGDGSLLGRAEPRRIPELSGVVRLASFEHHTCAVLRTGQVSCWGSNARGQLGDGTVSNRNTPRIVTRLDRVVDVAVGVRHSCALQMGGAVLCWGDNAEGQLGDGTLNARPLPEPVRDLPAPAEQVTAGDDFTCARLRGGQVACWGDNGRREVDPSSAEDMVVLPRLVPGVDGVVELAAGGSHVCARKHDRSVSCWGHGTSGQTGRGAVMGASAAAAMAVPQVREARALAAGDGHTCALVANDRVACWGANATGQAGVDKPENVVLPGLVPVSNATVMAAGGRHTCAVLADLTMRCWGDRSEGQLGDGFAVITPEARRVELAGVAEIAGGSGFTCARLSDGQVTCWGGSGFGRLGERDGRSRPSPGPAVAVTGAAQVVAGTDFACARATGGHVQCWGRGDSGQLGDGLRKSGPGPVAVALTEPATDVAAGGTHACAVLASGRLACWGSNGRGQLGVVIPATEPQYQVRPVEVPEIEGAIEVAAGNAHTCARLAGGVVKCWGSSDNGQLGPGAPSGSRSTPTVVDELGEAVDLAAGGNHVCARLAGGAVRCWGAGGSGQLGSGVLTDRNPRPMDVADLPAPAEGIAAGGNFTCARTARGVACWGQNRSGEVGDGTQILRTTAVPVVGLPAGLTGLGAGDAHACAVSADGALHCWGRNWSGETGRGDPLWRAAPEMVRLGCP